MTLIPNRGTAGSALDATNNGLTRVEGGAVWFPRGGVGNRLTATDFGSLATDNFTLDVEFVSPYEIGANVNCYGRTTSSGGGGGWEARILAGGTMAFSYHDKTEFKSLSGGNVEGAKKLRWTVVFPTLTMEADYGDGAGWVDESPGGLVMVSTIGYQEAAYADIGSSGGNQYWLGQAMKSCVLSIEGAASYGYTEAIAGSLNPAATTFIDVGGSTWSVNRSTSGPVTTLVPAGTVVYINPNDAVGGNRITTASNPATELAPDEDALLMWCGLYQRPPSVVGMEIAVRTAGGSQAGMRMFSRDSDTVSVQFSDTDGSNRQTGITLASGFQYETVVFAQVVDRLAATSKINAYGAGWEVLGDPISIAGEGGFDNSLGFGILLMQSKCGVASSWIWNKGVGIAPSDTKLASIAAALIANANRPSTHTTGALPPAGHKVRGDTYRAKNGHKAQFDGTNWQPVTPATGNIAALLADATFLIDAAGSQDGEQVARNRGVAGDVLNARYGSTTSADTNDPLLLTHTGDNYVYFPGSVENLLANNTEFITPTQNVEIVTRVQWWADIASHGDGGNASWVSNWYNSTQTRNWMIGQTSIGSLSAWNSNDTGAAYNDFSDSVLSDLTDGVYWFKVRFDVDNLTISAWFAPDSPIEPNGSQWTALTPVTLLGNHANPRQAGPFAIGGLYGVPTGANPQDPIEGPIHYVRVTDKNTDTVLVELQSEDMNDSGATTITPTVGPVLTVRRSTSGRKTALVTRPVWLFGTDDYMEVAHNALIAFDDTENFTLMAVTRAWPTLGSSNNHYLSKIVASNGAGYRFYFPTGGSSYYRFNIEDGAGLNSASDAPDFVYGDLETGVAVWDRDNEQQLTYMGADVTTPVNTTGFGAGMGNDTGPLHIGSNDGVNGFTDAEIISVAIWRRALTPAEITALNTFYGTA
jgi:hypothetical protein